MITEEHLRHWIQEINYQLTGVRNELNKKEFQNLKVVTINEQAFSFEYAREKVGTITSTLKCIEDDIKND